MCTAEITVPTTPPSLWPFPEVLLQVDKLSTNVFLCYWYTDAEDGWTRLHVCYLAVMSGGSMLMHCARACLQHLNLNSSHGPRWLWVFLHWVIYRKRFIRKQLYRLITALTFTLCRVTAVRSRTDDQVEQQQSSTLLYLVYSLFITGFFKCGVNNLRMQQ